MYWHYTPIGISSHTNVLAQFIDSQLEFPPGSRTPCMQRHVAEAIVSSPGLPMLLQEILAALNTLPSYIPIPSPQLIPQTQIVWV